MTRLEVRRLALRRNLVRQPAPARRASLTGPRLPAAADVAITGAGYLAYALVRLAVRADRHAAFAHAAELWRAERWLHLDVEPSLNHLVAAGPALAEAAGYYHDRLLHFIVTPLVLGWLYLRRPSAFPRLRSALVLATSAANIVFWTWPVAPPRYSVPGMTDILVSHHVLGAAGPHGPDRLVRRRRHYRYPQPVAAFIAQPRKVAQFIQKAAGVTDAPHEGPLHHLLHRTGT